MVKPAQRSCGRSTRSFALSLVTFAGMLLSAACWRGAHAEEGPAVNAERYFSIIGDNDFFAGYDQHYTNGLQIAVSADQTAKG